MSTTIKKTGASALAESLDVADESYELASARYGDIGKWLNDPSKSASARFKPRIFPQGSFRLGTVTQPPAGQGYDLDLACCLQDGVTPATHTQKALKLIVGGDLEQYRKARNIQDPLEEKHRCWRLNYQDHVNFHIDTVPSVPYDVAGRSRLRESMVKFGVVDQLAKLISEDALAITDDRHPTYSQLSPDWNISNPEGFARWFESRMRQAAQLLESRAEFFKVASIEKLPVYRWKTPLQQALQMLKQHRDIMFKDQQERKPISIIITTLAAHAYRGEEDVQDTLDRVLADMGKYIRRDHPRVPNPVNPAEDFADKWATQAGRALQLEQNFHGWLTRARVDFGLIAQAKDKGSFEEQSMKKFGVRVKESALAGLFSAASRPLPTVHKIHDAPKPWRKQ
jgi:hypothetical protein